MKKTKFFCLFAAALLGVSGAIAGASNAFETGLEPTAIQKNAADDEAALVAAQARFYALVEEAGQLAMKDIPQEYKEMLLAACDANIETLEACYAAIENLETLIEAIKAMLNENETVKNEKYQVIFSQNYEDAEASDWTSPNAQTALIIETDTVNAGINKFMGYNFKAVNLSTNSRGAYLWFGSESKLTGITDYIISVDINVLSRPNNQVAQWNIFGEGSAYASKNVNYGADAAKPVFLSLVETAKSADTYTVRIGLETLSDPITLNDSTWYTVKQVVNETAGTVKTTIASATETVLQVTTNVDFAALGKVKGLYLISGRYLGGQAVDNISVVAPMSKMKVQTLAVDYEDGELGGWVSPNAGTCLLVETDSISGNKYFSYDFHDTNTNTNSRGAYLWFNVEDKLDTDWTFSFDMNPDYLPNNQAAQWNVFGTNSGYSSNNVNWGVDTAKPTYLTLIETAKSAETYNVYIGGVALSEPITLTTHTWYTVKQEVTANSIHTVISDSAAVVLDHTAEVGSETVGKLKGFYLLSGRYLGKQNIDNISIVTPQPKVTVEAFAQDYEEAEASDWTSPNAQTALIIETDSVNAGINKFMGYNFKAVNLNTNSRGAYLWFGCEEKLAGIEVYEISVDINVLSRPNNQAAQWNIFGTNSGYTSNNVNYGADAAKPVYLSLVETAKSANTYNVRIGSETLSDPITLNDSTWYTIQQTVEATTIHTVISNGSETVLDVVSEVGFETIGFVKGMYLVSGRYLGGQAVDNIKVSYVTYGETCDDPVIKVAGNDYDVKTVTISCATEGSTIQYTLGADTLTYSEPFLVSNNATVTAWAFTENASSYPVAVDVVAGQIAAPTYAMVASKGETRSFTLATATPGAVISYSLNGAEAAVYSDTITVSETTEVKMHASRQSEVVDSVSFSSEDVTFTVEAGKALQLNPVSVVKVSDSAEEWVFVVDNSSADIIGQPETQISYEVYPSGEKADVAHGDTLTFATHKRISLVADAEGYATSEPTVVWTREPAQLELVWEDDFKTNAEQTLDGGNYTVVLQPTTFSAEGTDFCPVQVSDDYISNANFGVQSGTNWLQRNVNGYIGLYNYNSGPRRIGINNLRKTQVVKFTVQDPAQVSLVNDVLQLDETNSTANTLYYNCVKDGAAVLSMSRYYCIWKVEVYNNPDVTASPNVYIAGMNEDKSRQVAVVPAEVAYPKNQFTFYALANGTHKDSTMVVNEADTTYSYFDVQDYTDFAPFEEIFSVSKPNNIVLAYAEYEGKKSEIAEVTIDCDSIYSLIDPTISWIEKGEAGHSFTIANRNLIEAGLYPVLKFAYGEDIVDLYGEKVDIDAKGSGWMTVQAVLPGMDTTYVVSRYVAEAREAYDAAYFSVMNGDTLTLSGSMGEFEAAAGAVVSGKYPEKNIAVTGVQYIHQAVTSNYTAMTMPFALNPSVNVITDAAGHKLTFGEDYEILTLHNNTNANVNTGKNAENVISVSNIEACKRTTSMAAGTPILFRALTEKVGSEIIVQSQAKAAVTVAATATTQPTGWKIFGNKQFLSVALEGGAYVLNEEGKKFVWTENPTVGSLGVVIMADAAIKAVLGNEIDLSATTAIEEIATELDELPVYDLQGMKVENAKAGQIYIMGGKRILNK